MHIGRVIARHVNTLFCYYFPPMEILLFIGCSLPSWRDILCSCLVTLKHSHWVNKLWRDSEKSEASFNRLDVVIKNSYFEHEFHVRFYPSSRLMINDETFRHRENPFGKNRINWLEITTSCFVLFGIIRCYFCIFVVPIVYAMNQDGFRLLYHLRK